jgi:hypothetical protein
MSDVQAEVLLVFLRDLSPILDGHPRLHRGNLPDIETAPISILIQRLPLPRRLSSIAVLGALVNRTFIDFR